MPKRLPPYGPLASVAEERLVAPFVSQAFDVPEKGYARWIRKAGRGNARVCRHRGRPVGALVAYPMALWWGGRSVPASGIAGVAVAAEHRGRGKPGT